MVLNKTLATIITLLLIASFTKAKETRFQQYTQEFSNPPAYNYYIPYFYRYHKPYMFHFDYHYQQQNNQARQRYIQEQDKNTYVSPSEFNIKAPNDN